MPREYDSITQQTTTVKPNAVYLILAETSDNTAEMGKILASYCVRSSGTESQRFAYHKLIEFLKFMTRWLNF